MAQRPIKSVAKGLDLLFLFSSDRPRWTVGELAAATRLPLSTTYRYLVTFRRHGLIEEDGREGAYRLSPRLLQLAEAVATELDLARRARPFMERLAQRTRETVQLVVRSGDFGTCVERAESPETLRVRPERGRSIPLHAGASMKVILAFLPAEEQHRLLARPLERFTEHTVTNPRALRRELRAIREAGYAMSFQEIYPGVRAVAVPVLDARGMPIASLAIAGPGDRFTERRARALAPDLIRGGRTLGPQWGEAPPPAQATERGRARSRWRAAGPGR